jgi:hypothetical protein
MISPLFFQGNKRKVRVFASPSDGKWTSIAIQFKSPLSVIALLLILTYCATFGICFHFLTVDKNVLSAFGNYLFASEPNPTLELHIPQPPKSEMLPVFYINLDKATGRQKYITEHLKERNFRNVHRVRAWTAQDVTERVEEKVSSLSNMLAPDKQEIGCIASHLHAMFLAVNDTSNTSPYAIIIEDDVRFPFAVDWKGMIESAPKDFAILQLTTSNSYKMSRLWDEYKMIGRNWLRAQNDTLAELMQEKKPPAQRPMRLRKIPESSQSLGAQSKKEVAKARPSLSRIVAEYQWKKRNWDSEY